MNHFLRSGALTGHDGTLARVLKRLGPSWRASPLRRLVQLASLALYLVLFFHVAWPHFEPFDAGLFASREYVPAELYLLLDPLVAVSAALAARALPFALVWAGAIVAANLVVPRGFCGYLCPLGTLIDGFDWLIEKASRGRVKRLRMERRGWWTGLRWWILAAVLGSSALGVMAAGHFAAMPLLNRGMRLGAGAVQLGIDGRWDAAAFNEWTSWVALAAFAAVFLLGIAGKRFWCRCLCPTGAVFSLAGGVAITGRRLGAACTGCGKCTRACSFDAVGEGFETRRLDCAFCETCGGVCPVGAVTFGLRRGPRDAAGEAPCEPTGSAGAVTRRAFLVTAAKGAGAVAVGGAFASGIRFAPIDVFSRGRAFLRPPGSVDEARFLDLCVRCGECMRVCPGPVLHPAGLGGGAGLEALWTPVAVPVRAGCREDCNLCTQVCPTGAIRPLTLDEKREFCMGLAVVNAATCLPYVGREECRVCHDVCAAAGYRAIHLTEIALPVGDVPGGVFSALELEEMSRILAPVVDPPACVGCGLCENRCHVVNVVRERKLAASAVTVRPPEFGY
jgi:ferredoxin